MSDTPTPETDKAEDSDPMVEGEWHWIVPSSFARRLERERDKAREELAILKAECAKISEEFGLPPTVRPADGEIKRMINGWKEALEERDEARRDLVYSEELHRRRFGTLRKELVAANRGAEINAKVNQGLCARLTEAERERDEARRALEWISKRYCYEKTTSQLAVEAYEMFSMARWTLQGMTLEEGA